MKKINFIALLALLAVANANAQDVQQKDNNVATRKNHHNGRHPGKTQSSPNPNENVAKNNGPAPVDVHQPAPDKKVNDIGRATANDASAGRQNNNGKPLPIDKPTNSNGRVGGDNVAAGNQNNPKHHVTSSDMNSSNNNAAGNQVSGKHHASHSGGDQGISPNNNAASTTHHTAAPLPQPEGNPVGNPMPAKH